ncbi:hypothetical protein B0H17DRAFT_1261739 [Mycena rosella]|uniref:Uncharacterized protein n=1 Tax=Mycena rosella TaxID=1033263 RepID=A0AAD7CR27_MYCRO|nr:hypothetical protein B0H17DRAFT_1261739 [Mycena rosella]
MNVRKATRLYGGVDRVEPRRGSRWRRDTYEREWRTAREAAKKGAESCKEERGRSGVGFRFGGELLFALGARLTTGWLLLEVFRRVGPHGGDPRARSKYQRGWRNGQARHEGRTKEEVVPRPCPTHAIRARAVGVRRSTWGGTLSFACILGAERSEEGRGGLGRKKGREFKKGRHTHLSASRRCSDLQHFGGTRSLSAALTRG